jgi:hypothetical protein
MKFDNVTANMTTTLIFPSSLSGSSFSDTNGDLSLCNVENFSPSKWLTLGRTSSEDPPHCPLVGEYTGVVPDAEGLCAKSYTDCNNPEVMFYTVFNCHNKTEIFEEREYRCFGQWEEEGLVYTYTERRDVPGNECFVGKTIDADRNVIAEAGQNCERGHQPDKYGMTLHRQAKCQHEMTIPTTDESEEEVVSEPVEPQEETIEQLLKEEEEEERFVKEQRTVSPRLVHHKKTPSNNNKHRNRHHHNQEAAADIFSNEIPGSSSPSLRSSSAAAPTASVALMLLMVLLSCWRTCS